MPPAQPSSTFLAVAGAVTSALTIAGLVILVALGKITWGDAGPLIGGLAGLHSGAVIANTSSK